MIKPFSISVDFGRQEVGLCISPAYLFTSKPEILTPLCHLLASCGIQGTGGEPFRERGLSLLHAKPRGLRFWRETSP